LAEKAQGGFSWPIDRDRAAVRQADRRSRHSNGLTRLVEQQSLAFPQQRLGAGCETAICAMQHKARPQHQRRLRITLAPNDDARGWLACGWPKRKDLDAAQMARHGVKQLAQRV